MRVSQSLFRTEREAPSDSKLVSHQRLVRSGLVKQVAAGIYSLTPLSLRVIHKISDIIREEMNRIGGQEVLLPVTQPSTLWEQSGRYGKIDASLARWKDRNGQDMVLAMTHEEAATDLVRHFVNSYRQLPQMIYQIQMKFRDEARPRGGLVRLREFLMKDAYSFHTDEEGLDDLYQKMIGAYERIYDRCGVRVLQVQADTGMMGGGMSHEFMVLSDGGEDSLIVCRNCGYAANSEVAVSTKDHTGSAPVWQFFIADTGRRILVGVPDSVQVNEVKLARVLGVNEVRPASQAETEMYKLPASGWPAESQQFEEGLDVVLDDTFVSHKGSDRYMFADVTTVGSGDECAHCGQTLDIVRGIEAGNIFKLGTHYSEPMQATYSPRDGSLHPFLMGSYGIGITRLLACIIENNHDKNGISWPENVAPYRYHLISIGADDDIIKTANDVYQLLGQDHVFYDDRETTAGVKFTDADLLGLPYRLTISRKSLTAGGIECKNRGSGEVRKIPLGELEAVLIKVGGEQYVSEGTPFHRLA
jgi:prolyl-tRNA synthetase